MVTANGMEVMPGQSWRDSEGWKMADVLWPEVRAGHTAGPYLQDPQVM